jgi:hypothetical protein
VKPAAIIFALTAGGLAYAQAPPAPFTVEDRLNHYVHRTFSPERMALLGADTAVEQLFDRSHDWHSGSRGFMHRYSSNFGSRLVRNSIELGAGMALGEDTRFEVSGKSGFASRLAFAASGSVLARDGQGKRGFSYARLAATVGGTLITSIWRPCANSPRHHMEEIGSGYLGHLQNSLLTEFSPDLLRFGKKVRTAIFKH